MRRGWRMAAVGAMGVGALSAWACLPDLEIATTPPVPPSPCGDGYIDPDAGETCDPGEAGTSSAACPLCRMTCLGPSGRLDPTTNHCYFSLPELSSIDAAVSGCEEAGAHVVRFVSEDELSLVAGDAPTAPFWIGLRKVGQAYPPIETTPEPGWVASCTGCFGELDAATLVECVQATKDPDAGWATVGCLGKKNLTMCEQEPPGSRAIACGDGDVCLTTAVARSKRYVFVPGSERTHDDAVQLCKDRGGHLPVFASREEREELVAEVAALTHRFWIGLTKSGGWSWDVAVDGGIDPSEVWGEKQPLNVGTSAYVSIVPGQPDSALAQVAAPAVTSDVVCEL